MALIARGLWLDEASDARTASFFALRAHLAHRHGVELFNLIVQSDDPTEQRARFIAQLAKPDITQDQRTLELADELREALSGPSPTTEDLGASPGKTWATRAPRPMPRRLLSDRKCEQPPLTTRPIRALPAPTAEGSIPWN